MIIALYLWTNGYLSPPFRSPGQELKFSPLFKMFGGGQGNSVSADFLSAKHIDFVGKNGNKSMVIVDIGVYNGHEAALAVASGFTVFGFEPINKHIHDTFRSFKHHGLSDRIKFINLTALLLDEFDDDLSKLEQFLTKDHALREYPLSDVTASNGKGFCYLFQAATSNEFKKIIMEGRDTVSDMANTSPGRNGGGHPLSTVVTLPVSRIVFHDVFWFNSDTQGHELPVLEGAVPLFQEYNVHAMTIEFWPAIINKHYGEDGLWRLLKIMEQELGLRMCFLSMTNDWAYTLLHHKTMGLEEFYWSVWAIKDELTVYEFPWFDDLTCS